MKKSCQKAFTRAGFAALLLSSGISSALAQTNGTLTGTGTALTYSTAPFTNLTGPGTYPDGGGTLTLNPITGPTPGTVGATTTLTFDVSPTLSSIVFNTPIQYILATGAGQSIVASANGLTLNAQNTALNSAALGIPNGIAFGSQITGSISGGGAFGVTKTGTGNLTLAGASTYTGGTHFNGGFTTINSTAAVGDTVFGATGAGNGLSFNGGSVLFNTTSGLTTTRDIFIDAGGATMTALTATTLGGVISGTGSLTNIAFGGVALSLTGVNTYTGATITRSSNTALAAGGPGPNAVTTLSGNGSILASSSADLMGTFNLDNTGTNVANRMSDTAPVTVRGINFISTGNASATSSETIGAVTGANGFNTFLVTPGGGTTTPQANSLTMASLARQNNATFDFRGAGLGGTPGAGVSNIFATTAPTLTGGGGAAGSTVISIVPYAIGNNTTSVLFTAAGQVSSSFVTYDANGFRPLATTEYATAFGGSALDNVRINAATAVAAPVTANSVLVSSTGALLTGAGPITITSGAFLYSPTANAAGTVSAALNFGAAEGVVTNTSTVTMSGVLSGSNGLTLTTAFPTTGNLGYETPTLSLSGANTYTGNTTINSGVVGFSGTIANGTAGAFGTSGTVILNAGNNLVNLAPTALTTFNRDISVIGNGQNLIGPTASGYTSTFNGNINLAGSLLVAGYTNVAANALIFNGTISGTGGIADNNYTYAVFNGNNTYSGGTILNGTTSASTFYAGSDTAFGTGTITINSTGSIAGIAGPVAATTRTLANNLFLNSTGGFAGAFPLTLTGAVNLNGSRTATFSNTALTTFTGVVSNGSFTKAGTGAVAFNSSTGNTFAGGFVAGANVGAIYANNASGSAFGAGAVSVGATSATVFSTLAGSFTTAGATSIAGRLSPGNTPAALTAATAGIGAIGTAGFNGAFTLSSATTSSLYLEAASNISHDQLNVGGLFTLNGTVFIATTGGFSFSQGTVIDFADWSSITVGTVTFNTTGATVDPGYALDTSFFTTDGTIRVIAVPEPTTWAIFGVAGALGLAGYARRRRAA